MFNIFRRKKKKNIACISYVVDHDFDVKIDIQIEDYEDESIGALSALLKMLSSDDCFIETIQFVRNGLLAEKREDLIIKVVMPIAEEINKKIKAQSEKHNKELPFIKPSDLSQK
jgi:hypothetical protein